MRTGSVLLLSLCLVACGGSSGSTTAETREEGTVFSSGGETETRAPVFRTTTPIPVPSPAIARDALSPALDRVWTQVEEMVAMSPPDPPASADDATVEAWSNGPFLAWVQDRITRIEAASTSSLELEGAPAYERGIAAGVIAYALEVTAAEARSAPIPEHIAADPELLAAYVEGLNQALLPFAERAAQAFLFCAAAFDETGDAAWLEWRTYCADRNADVVDSYGLGDGTERPTNATTEGGAAAPAAGG